MAPVSANPVAVAGTQTPRRGEPEPPGSPRTIWGLEHNVFWAGVVSFFMDVSSEMVYSLVPIFLSSVLWASTNRSSG